MSPCRSFATTCCWNPAASHLTRLRKWIMHHRVGRQLRDCCMIAPVLASFRYPIVLAKATFPTCLPFATKCFRVKGCCIIQTSTNIYDQTLIYFPRERPHDQACGRQWGSDMHDSPVIAPWVSLTPCRIPSDERISMNCFCKWHIVSKRWLTLCFMRLYYVIQIGRKDSFCWISNENCSCPACIIPHLLLYFRP
jgi:hypothetical protein